MRGEGLPADAGAQAGSESAVIPDSVYRFVIWELEGGDKIHDRGAADPGGVTKFGFAQQYNPDIDVRTLTDEQARARADERYWRPARCYEFPPGLALMHFDCAFNQGVGTAIRLLQAAVGVRVDGVIGPVTVQAAQAWDPRALLKRYAKLRKEAWLRLNNVVEESNENGWLNRLLDVVFEALK